jgi:hypothetical protein
MQDNKCGNGDQELHNDAENPFTDAHKIHRRS